LGRPLMQRDTRRMLALWERLLADQRGLPAVQNLAGQANLAWLADDREMAQTLFERARTACGKLPADSPDLARGSYDLGESANSVPRWTDAGRAYELALAICENRKSSGSEVAFLWFRVGDVATNQEEFAAARRFYERALALWEAAGNSGG